MRIECPSGDSDKESARGRASYSNVTAGSDSAAEDGTVRTRENAWARTGRRHIGKGGQGGRPTNASGPVWRQITANHGSGPCARGGKTVVVPICTVHAHGPLREGPQYDI
mmetsp:Transcript_16209/g.24718  ORF Transcript_16209/g.24718 Transcript_16209/m.24718 type:complete len:110 (-) Transcript_16209:30-359(-)